MTHTTYVQQVAVQEKVSGKCIICGARIFKRKTFIHTINPWNLNESGTVKTYLEVMEDVIKERDKWEASQPVIHEKCRRNVKEGDEVHSFRNSNLYIAVKSSIGSRCRSDCDMYNNDRYTCRTLNCTGNRVKFKLSGETNE